MENKVLKLGLAGMGTVGGGVADLLDMNRDWIKRRSGVDVVIHSVLELEQNKERVAKALPDAKFCTDMKAFAQDADVDVVVELVGGDTFARTLMTTALEAGKHAVTANKALLAKYGHELFPLAAEKGVHLCYEASVAGGIPTVQTIKEGLAANRTQKLMGIINGTANFILTEMSTKGMGFDEALKLAQEKGFAEADPTLDIEGWDAAHKLVLLIQLAFGQYYALDKLPVWGVSIVGAEDISFAKEFGCQIKLIAQAQDVDGKIEAGVFPALISEDSMLAAVQGSFNAVLLEGNAGPIMLYGHGAGDLPTASAVLADIINIAKGTEPNNMGFVDTTMPEADILDLDEAVSEHYLRFTVPDATGTLRDIAGVLADHDISIAKVVQKGKDAGKGVPIVFLTHEASAKAVHAAMREIETTGIPLAPIIHYRIL